MFVNSAIPNCPSCKKAKALLDIKKLEYEVKDIMVKENLDEFSTYGWRTVPQLVVHIGDKRTYIGGFEALEKYLK